MVMGAIKLSQGKVALVDDTDFEWLNQWKWFYHQGYAERSINLGIVNGKQKTKNVKMHRLILGTLPAKPNLYIDPPMVDHINGDSLDNRRSNLRGATSKTNQQNRKVHYNKRFKGVNWHKRIGAWQVSIRVDKQLKHIGYFDDEIIAAKKYNEAALLNFGEFARLNNV